jgi:arsenate reductase
MSTPDVTLLHNPRCSKSRALKAALDERGGVYSERRYLDEPLDAAELARLVARLDRPAAALVRTKEPAYAATGLGPDSDDASVLAALTRHPELLERPVLIVGDRAALGRPDPEAALELLSGGAPA